MKIIARNAEYVIKVVTRDAEQENAGYQYAVFTREEAKYGALAYPEWQADSFRECLEWIDSAVARKYNFSVAPEYRAEFQAWLQE